MPRDYKSISRLNVACFLLVTIAAASASFLAPILAHQLQVRNQERKESILASIALDKAGISECRFGYPEIGEAIDNVVPGPSRLSATVWPSFQVPWGIRLVGDEVYLVQLTTGYWPIPPPPKSDARAATRPDVTTKVQHAPLTSAAAQDMARLFAVRTMHVDQEERMGADGATYYFLSGSRCAQTWSPDPESGAGRMVQLVDLLAEHAQMTNQKDLEVSEHKMASLAKSFHHGPR